MKTNRVISALLIAALILCSVSGCGGGENAPAASAGNSGALSEDPGSFISGTTTETESETVAIDRAEVFIPTVSDAQELAQISAAMSVDAYLYARAELDRFLTYDVNSGNPEEYLTLLEKAAEAFNTVDKLAGGTADAAELWMAEKDSGKKAELISSSENPEFWPGIFAVPVFAADDSAAVKWAKDITDTFDKAPAGKGIRTLAEQLGTDAKHAFAQLKQAQDILEGAEYSEIADAANRAYQVAVALKTAGTACAFVLSIPAAPASGALAAAVNTGGMVVSGANAILEIGSAGSIIYTNGEGNWLSAACDQTESQFAPIGQIFAIAGLVNNVQGLRGTYKDIAEKGKSVFTQSEVNSINTDIFGVISYGMGTISDYTTEGKILSGAFTHTEEGLKFTLADTVLGTSEEEKAAVKEMLTEAGIPEEAVDTAMSSDAKSTEAPAGPEEAIPAEVGGAIAENYGGIADFDAADYVKSLDNALQEIAETSAENGALEEELVEIILVLFAKCPDISEIAGTYSGSVKVTRVIVSDEAYEAYLSGDPTDVMTQVECDEVVEQMIAEGEIVISQSFNISVLDEAAGKVRLSFSIIGDDGENTPFHTDGVYADGIITCQSDEGDCPVELTLTDSGISLNTERIVAEVREEEAGLVMFWFEMAVEGSK